MLALIIIALILFSLRRPMFGGLLWPFGGWWYRRPPMDGPMHCPGMGRGPGMGGMGGPMGGGPRR